MRKLGFIIGFICLIGSIYAEDITLMSYYPVPSGNYNNIKTKRMWIGEGAGGSLLTGGSGILQVGDITSYPCSIYGHNIDGIGVYGESRETTTRYSGVYGISTNGKGVEGVSTNFYGVLGQSSQSHGVVGGSTYTNGSGYGVYGWSVGSNGVGVYGSSPHIGVYAESTWSTTGSYGLYATGGEYAGYFDGNLNVTKRANFGIPNIPVFSSTTARDSFYTANGMTPQQGDIIYLNDSSPSLQIHIGSTWRDL